MTVSSTTNRKSFTGDAVTTSFGTSPMVFFDTSDLKVYVVTTATGAATLLTENTHYTVSGGAGSTGTVSLAGGSAPYGAPSASQTLLIVRELPLTQETDLANNDASDAEVVEDAFDRLTIIAQQLNDVLDRSLTLPTSDVSGASTELPVPSANTLIGWDSAGTALENKTPADVDLTLVSAFMATLLDDADAAAARITLGVAPQVVDRAANTILAADDYQKIFRATAGFTQTFTAAATLGARWYCGYRVESGATLVLDPNGAETIDGAATKSIVGPSSGFIFCNGTAFYTIGFPASLGSTARVCDGRLTLATGTPIVTTDQTAKGTVYFTPFRGNRIELYTSGAWANISFAETSVAVPATTNKPFDIFAYNNAGTLALETVDWTNDTTRATALTTQDGVYVKSGDATRRYLGTGRTTGVSGQTQTSFGAIGTVGKWFLWNYYNRQPVDLISGDSTNSWTYTTATWRQVNAAATNQSEFVLGVAEDVVRAQCVGAAVNGTTASVSSGVGVDSTSANSAQVFGGVAASVGSSVRTDALYEGYMAAGYHYLAALEISQAVSTTTWYGDNGVTYTQTGMKVRIQA